MKTLTVTLKQHTPLIHFQHNQYGATLRASEVKPKLDRYIIEKIGNGSYDDIKLKEKVKKEHESWFVKKEGVYALNYKLKIETIAIDKAMCLAQKTKFKFNPRTHKEDLIYETASFPLLLSNMGGKKEKEELVNFSYSESICLYFVFMDKSGNETTFNDLINVIKSWIASFFAHTNWGQRQNKGFGSFTVCKIEDQEISWKDDVLYEKNIQLMRYKVNTQGFKKMFDLFSVIDFYWKCLKSGVNYTRREVLNGTIIRKNRDRYIKSFLWTYLEGEGVTWEKKKIKNGLYLECRHAKGDGKILSNERPYFFARAHLGCPIDGFTYRIPQGRNIKDKKGREVEEIKSVDIILDNDKNIKRIASPIIFKPVFHEVDDQKVVSIYILYDEQIITALQKENEVIFNFKRKKGQPTESVKIPLFLLDDQGQKLTLNYYNLINQFHKSLGTKMVVRDIKWNNILGDEEVAFYELLNLNK